MSASVFRGFNVDTSDSISLNELKRKDPELPMDEVLVGRVAGRLREGAARPAWVVWRRRGAMSCVCRRPGPNGPAHLAVNVPPKLINSARANLVPSL